LALAIVPRSNPTEGVIFKATKLIKKKSRLIAGFAEADAIYVPGTTDT
jgi:hypothetical protein